MNTTPENDAGPAKDLLLPATAELLEGWCGPVVVELVTGEMDEAVLLRRDGHEKKAGDWVAAPVEEWSDCEATAWGDMARYVPAQGERLYLDLARAECRDRVRRTISGNAHDSAPAWSVYAGVGGNWFGGWHEPEAADAWAGRSRGGVPALADLDPNDDTRLPDGSRLVDARALLAVARAVFGV